METPKDKLKRMTAWDVEPALSEDDLDGLLTGSALEDEAGLAPANDDWTPTYDFNAAASAAWLVKAARASALTEVDPPESGIVTSKVFDNCPGNGTDLCGKTNGVPRYTAVALDVIYVQAYISYYIERGSS